MIVPLYFHRSSLIRPVFPNTHELKIVIPPWSALHTAPRESRSPCWDALCCPISGSGRRRKTTAEEYAVSFTLNQDKRQKWKIIGRTNPWTARSPNGNTWLKAEVLSAARTVTFLFDNLACHKIRIANTSWQRCMFPLYCAIIKTPLVTPNATNFNLNLQRRERRSDMHSKILITY